MVLLMLIIVHYYSKFWNVIEIQIFVSVYLVSRFQQSKKNGELQDDKNKVFSFHFSSLPTRFATVWDCRGFPPPTHAQPPPEENPMLRISADATLDTLNYSFAEERLDNGFLRQNFTPDPHYPYLDERS